MTGPVLVLLEHDRGELADAALEALTAARALGDQLGAGVAGVLVGCEDDETAFRAAAAEAGRHGAAVVHLALHELVTDYGPDAWAEAVLQLAGEVGAAVVLATGTDRGNEVLAQMAARADAPFVANTRTIDCGGSAGGEWAVTRTQWGGSLLEDVTVSVGAGPRLLTIAHHAVAPEPVEDGGSEPELERFEPELDRSVTVTLVRSRSGSTAGGATLATAPVVVSGGRGVGSAEGFAVLEELAGLLGGVVGCSRAVTNNGWRPHTDQVGQTGTRIAPDLYIASGISGAIQHWVGAMASKRILAINTDPEANMVTRADYAVIGDLHQVVPAISAEIRRRRGGQG